MPIVPLLVVLSHWQNIDNISEEKRELEKGERERETRPKEKHQICKR